MAKNMIYRVLFIFLMVFVVSCTTTAQSQFYRPANYGGNPFQISGRFEPMSGLNGVVYITINGQDVIRKPFPVFSNTTDADGEFQGVKITATITRITTFISSYLRADVFFGSEKAATLTF